MTIRKIIISGLLGTAAAVLIAQSASALTIYNDSGTHNLSSPQGDVSVSNATTVDFLGGSSATGLNAGTAGSAVMVTGASTATVNGGNLLGGNDTDGGGGFGGHGINAADSSVLINSGSLTGGNKTGSGFGGYGISANNSDVTITGGTILGGNNAGSGFGGFGLLQNGGTLDVSGGSITGGDGSSIAGFAMNLFDVSGSISGGSFAIGSGFGSNLVSASNTTLDILGGAFETGKLWNLSDGSVFNVFGTGLVLTGTTSGTLSGTLQDGSSINVNYNLSSFTASSVININPQSTQVPEPGMLALFGLGVAGLGFARSKLAA